MQAGDQTSSSAVKVTFNRSFDTDTQSCPSTSDNSNDVLMTTKDKTKLGDIVTAKGVVHIDKDFGAGYTYKVLVEDATLQK